MNNKIGEIITDVLGHDQQRCEVVVELLCNIFSEEIKKQKEELSDLIINEIPTNWLDPMLSGKDAVLPGLGGTWGCPDIERLLKAIKKNMEKINDKS